MNPTIGKILAQMAATLKEGVGICGQGWDKDMAVFVTSPSGVVAAIDNELHLGSASEMVVSFLGPEGFPMEEGDVAVANDPYLGSPHVLDFYVLAPIHYQGGLIAFLGAKAHLPDIGGDIQGGMNLRAEEIWAEGVRITPLRFCQKGRTDACILNTILINSRAPGSVRVWLESMIAAIEAGRKEILSWANHSNSGGSFVTEETEKVILATESRIREVVGRWSNGEYLGEYMVDDERLKQEGLKIETKLLVKEAEIEIDFSGNRHQLKAPFNSPRGNTMSSALLPFFPLLDGVAFINGGIFKVVTIKTRKGTVVEPILPAPTSFSPFHVGQDVSMSVRAAMEYFLSQQERDRLAMRFPLLVNWHPRG